jgi:hypothetical protein
MKFQSIANDFSFHSEDFLRISICQDGFGFPKGTLFTGGKSNKKRRAEKRREEKRREEKRRKEKQKTLGMVDVHLTSR